MANGGQKRTRSERVAALELPPGPWERLWDSLRHRQVLTRVGLALLGGACLCIIVQGWDPPFAFRTGQVLQHDVVALASFSKPDHSATEDARDFARSRVHCVFQQNPEPLVQLRALVRSKVVEFSSATSLAEVGREKWKEFEPPVADDEDPPTDAELEEHFADFRRAVSTPEGLARFEKGLALALAPFERRGLLTKFPRELSKANVEEILVYRAGQPQTPEVARLSDVVIGDGRMIHENLVKELDSADLADRVFYWLQPRLRDTLVVDDAATKKALDAAVASVGEVLVKCQQGHTLVQAGSTVDRRQLHLLLLAHEAAMAQRTWGEKLSRATGVIALFTGLLVICAAYLRYRQKLLPTLKDWAMLLVMAILTVALSWTLSGDTWRAEIIPLLLFGMITAIAYRQEMALLFCGILATIIAMATGQGMGQFIVLLGVCTAAVLQLNQIRSRAKLIQVGLVSGLVAIALEMVTALWDDQPMRWQLLIDSSRTGAWTLSAGFLMTGLLPFVERAFGVLTDLSLLELGDVAHPLLQELIRRAPATYNHSITVGSIAEAAAESIGARGLLVRVGAYFHDIGKMLKPTYFVENQQSGQESLHEGLLPAMSTLVIIAHIKDGSDLGRQRHLPKPIIDLIEQHHGTMLVEYFFGRANEQKELDPNGGEVDEHIYRYPGPKPQTKEAGVLMLADAVEGASRALVDPTPARIESVVCGIADRRLQDGQSDESGLTLRELRTIQRSLIKSLTALYHGRIKYPEPRSA